MRQPFSGEIARFALVAMASVSVVGLFLFLALNAPDHILRAPASTPTPGPSAFELRHEAVEPPVLSHQGEATGAAAAEPAPPTAEEQKAPERTVDADDDDLAQPAPWTEKRGVKERSGFTPRSKRRPARSDLEPRVSPVKGLPSNGAMRSRASFETLPNKKCGDHEETDREPSSPDPLSDFIGGF